mgnify:CR=1 FL=1
MSTQILDIASWILLVSGGAFGVIGGIGIVRLPDFYSRLHASSITDTLAAYLIIAGLMLQAGLTLVTAKLGLILFFLFFTSPVAAHALASTAYHDGILPWTRPRTEAPLGPPEPPIPDPKLLKQAPVKPPAVVSPSFASELEPRPAGEKKLSDRLAAPEPKDKSSQNITGNGPTTKTPKEDSKSDS